MSCVQLLDHRITQLLFLTTKLVSLDCSRGHLSKEKSLVSIQHVKQKLEMVQFHLPHEQEREYQRTPARKRTVSPRYGHDNRLSRQVCLIGKDNASQGETFIDRSTQVSTVLPYYGHAHGHLSTTYLKKWHRGRATLS